MLNFQSLGYIQTLRDKVNLRSKLANREGGVIRSFNTYIINVGHFNVVIYLKCYRYKLYEL